MKKIYLLTILLGIFLNVNALAQRQWQWASPTPQGNLLNAICTVDSSSFFACGNYGTIIHGDLTYTNSFVTTQIGGSTLNLTDISFWNGSRGIVVGNKFVAMTSDGGRTWNKEINNVTTSDNWDVIGFRTDSVVFVLGHSGIIIASSDGGRTWQSKHTDNPFQYIDIQFVSKKVGFICGRILSNTTTPFLKTTDGGENWSVVSTITNCRPTSIHFFNSAEGIIISNTGVVHKTSDGGVTWHTIDSANTIIYNKVIFLNDSVGIAYRSSLYTFLITSNRGETWTNIGTTQMSSIFKDIIFLHTGQFIAIFDNKIYASSDTCKSWTLLGKKITPLEFYDISFSKSGTGFAVGGSGVIARSRNKGRAWEIMPNTTDSVALLSVSLLDGQHAIAVGGLGTILITSDSGNSWERKESNTSYELAATIYLTDSILITTSLNGDILRSYDGGKSWVTMHISSTSLFSLGFANANLGYAGSSSNEIFKTKNGGIDWTKLTVPSSDRYTSISCLDTLNIVAVGYHGTILKSTDGGNNWSKIPISKLTNFDHVQFIDSLNLVLIGDGDVLTHSTDGGITWPFGIETPADGTDVDGYLLSGYNFSKDTAVIVGHGILFTPPAYDTSWYPPFDTSWTPSIDTILNSVANQAVIESLSIYPNPMNNEAIVELYVISSDDMLLSVYDEKGLLVSRKKYFGLTEGKNSLNWNPKNLPNGTYILECKVGESIYRNKFVLLR